MNHIIWTDDFVLGIDKIDDHHRQLVALINLVADCLANSSPPAELSAVLEGLLEYADYHFGFEEAFMKEKGYPEIASHAQLHRGFSDRVTSLRKRFTAGDDSVIQDLSEYLEFWLIDHIVINDSLYASFAGTRDEQRLMI